MSEAAFDTGDARTRIAIVGSGPAGSYTAGHLLRHTDRELHVDLFERLPTPWGLVRAGVAPDHPKIKSVTKLYERTAEHPRLRLFANVEFGRHLTLDDLRAPLPRDRLRGRHADRPAAAGSPARSCRGATRRPTSSAGTTATPTSATANSTCAASAPS